MDEVTNHSSYKSSIGRPCTSRGHSKRSAARTKIITHFRATHTQAYYLKQSQSQNGHGAHRCVALGGGHPEVGAAGVEDDGERLRRRADADLAVVLRVEVVLQRHDVALLLGLGLVQRGGGVIAAAAEEAAAPLGMEAAVAVRRQLLQRDADQALCRRGEEDQQQRGGEEEEEEQQRDAAGCHGCSASWESKSKLGRRGDSARLIKGESWQRFELITSSGGVWVPNY